MYCYFQGTTEVYEGQTAHFECQVEPLHDPNLRIEFFHNGKPLPSAARFHITFDFGYVALDIGHSVPEDAGEYSVRAINALGQCTSSINLKVIPRENIILDSQRPEGMDKIRELEAQQPWKRPDVPEPQTRQRPVFTQPLQNIDAIPEGQTAHFECRLIPVGDPTLKVEWFRNEKPLETSEFHHKKSDNQFTFSFLAILQLPLSLSVLQALVSPRYTTLDMCHLTSHTFVMRMRVSTCAELQTHWARQ